MSSLATTSTRDLALKPPSAVPARITGSPSQWGRDLAVIGAVTGFTAPAMVLATGASWPFLAISGLTGLLCGLFLGVEMPRFLDSARLRMPLAAVAFRCTAVGGAVGGMIGLLAAQITGQVFVEPVIVASVAGAIQFGWFWLPYTVLTVVERPTWPLVVVACAVAPLLGPTAVWLIQAALGLIL